jgi:hypothetical protein
MESSGCKWLGIEDGDKWKWLLERWKCSGLDSGDACTTLNILKTAEAYTLKCELFGMWIIQQKKKGK